jgi:tetratricopeptide (TPR) repeat protein
LLAHPHRAAAVLAGGILLTLLAFLAHRAIRGLSGESQSSEYVLERVDRLDPERYVPMYVAGVYLPRRDAATQADADAAAREALRAAATRPDPAAPDGPLGICVFGRPTEGKTRLAWEAMRDELPDWTFVLWPQSRPQTPLDIPAQRGRRVVLWLDDLQKYSADEAGTLSDLPRRFAEAGARLVVVATCRDGADETSVRTRLGSLLDRLAPIRPRDITRDEAEKLAAALEKVGRTTRMDQFDRTPGSLLLGVRRMRDERYPLLSPDARHILWALKLLRSAGMYEPPAARVRAVAVEIFQLPEGHWRDACLELRQQAFVRLERDPDGDLAPVPIADVYLEQAVPDYPPASGASEADDWPALQEVLTRRRDAGALNLLGIAFHQRPLGDLRENQRRAVACYCEAQRVYTREAAPADWALTQNNLGNALAEQAGLAEGETRATLLEQAVEAYRAALAVRTREAAPADWAMTQNNLGNALAEQAGLAEGQTRATLLEQAVEAYRAALAVRTREAAPADWAQTQNNLGNALAEQAGLAEGQTRATLLEQAVEAYRAALAVFTREAEPTGWAMTRYNLALAHGAIADLLAGEGDVRGACAALSEARGDVEAALEVYTAEHVPVYHRRALHLLDTLSERQRALGCEDAGAE